MSDTKTTKVKTVKTDMAPRRVFDSPAEAAEYLNKMGEELSDFATTPLAMPGVDESGDFDPAIYNDQTRVMVGVLKSGGDVKAITVAPVPTLESLLADDAGKAWMIKILDKEFSHVSVRPLRDAEDVSIMIPEMPTSRDDYITSGRGQSAGIMVAFNELYKLINTTLAKKVTAWSKARIHKAELKKCFESAGYALEYYPALEDRGEGNESLFVIGLKLGIAGAKRESLDPTIFERWIDSRDAAAFEPDADEDEDDFDLDSLADDMFSDDEPADSKEEAPAEA